MKKFKSIAYFIINFCSGFRKRLPCLFGRAIKLCDLFVSVVSRGGYKKVCELRVWSDVARELNIPIECANVSIGLRRIYHQYLFSTERREYPEFSESFIPISDVDGVTADSLLHATLVEQNLGICYSTTSGQIHSFDQFERSARLGRNVSVFSNVCF